MDHYRDSIGVVANPKTVLQAKPAPRHGRLGLVVELVCKGTDAHKKANPFAFLYTVVGSGRYPEYCPRCQKARRTRRTR